MGSFGRVTGLSNVGDTDNGEEKKEDDNLVAGISFVLGRLVKA